MMTLLPVALPAFGVPLWSRTGHMIAASIAYRELPDSLKQEYTEILRHHPDFDVWEQDFQNFNPGFDLGEFVFMRASLWPDEIRRTGSPLDHPTWHYVNYPLRAPAFGLQDSPDRDRDILFGIQESSEILTDENASQQARAAHFSWLIHLIGDLHQPLHTTAFFSDMFPEGDRGGTRFFVRPAGAGVWLHSFWDGLTGTSSNAHDAHNEAIRLQTAIPRDSLDVLSPDTGSLAWSLEGRLHAIESVYLDGTLQGSATQGSAPSLPAGYATAAKSLAERQVVLAGYRLADLLVKFAITA